jgi:large subunit ribosomal protein L22
MAIAKAQLNDYRQSPRKVRVVARSLQGKKATDALVSLDFLAKRSSLPLAKLIASAIANAKNLSLETDNLFIKEIRVDGGKILYRRRSASRGRAPAIRKRTSHIQIVLETKEVVVKKPKATKK